jgi:hypothetical protein
MKALFLSLITASMFLTACGGKNGFGLLDPKASTDGNTSAGNGNSGGGTPATPPPTWEKVDLNGFQTGGSNDGHLVVYIDKMKQSLLLVLPIPMLIPLVAPVPIPDLPEAYLTSYTDAQGGLSVAVSIPLKYIVRQGVFMPNQRLPNGDDLPFVPAGELPGFAIQFPQMQNYRIHLYVGVNIAAAFVELPDFGLPIGWTVPVKNQSKTKIIGAIGYVLPKTVYAGGMYLAAQLPGDLARVIDELIRW